MSVVNTNVSASLAQSALMRNERALGSAMEQLSTGSKINSASDDAAGLAMAAKFTSQIKGLDMAVKNANDGISMISTAEGALNEVTNMLQRMRELAVQSSNGTMTEDDRSYMDEEYQALDAEIDRIEQNTTWNGVAILSGNAGQGATDSETSVVEFQISANYSGGSEGSEAENFTVADIGLPDGTTLYDNGATDEELDGDDNPTNNALTGDSTATEWADALAIYNAANEDATIEIHENLSGEEALTDTVKVAAVEATDSSDVISVDFGTLDDAIGSDGLSDVTTQGNAQAAIDTLDTAIQAVNEQRSKFGAASNRLTHAVDNMSNVKVNAEASRSRIEDTDYAKTTSELAKAQIIAQAGTAMLAQANQSSQSVLSLLR